MTTDYDMTNNDVETLNAIGNKASGAFASAVGIFMNASRDEGFAPKVAGAAFTLYALTHLTTVLKLCAGAHPDEVSHKGSLLLAAKAQKYLANLISEDIDKENQK